MDGEIILDRKNTNVMKLDDNEQALMKNKLRYFGKRVRERYGHNRNSGSRYAKRTSGKGQIRKRNLLRNDTGEVRNWKGHIEVEH